MIDNTCIICGTCIPDMRFSHDAYPIADGRCCSKCNYSIVIPGRIAELERIKHANIDL